MKKFEGKNYKYQYSIIPIFIKNSVSEHFSSLIISDCESFEKMSNIRFDAESNGLQTGVNFFLAIDFSPIHLVKILKNHANFIC